MWNADGDYSKRVKPGCCIPQDQEPCLALALAELQKANSFLVEKVASGRDVTLAPWTDEWHDTPEPPLAAASQSA
jgi:hypothetical protein